MSILTSVFGGVSGKNASKKADKVQMQYLDKALAQDQAQFDKTEANFQPFLQAGQQALGGSKDLLGLNGGTTQQSAIDALKASPGFTSLFNAGQDTILQNAAATGGLRGGNTQNSLASFGSNLLSTVIQQQLANYGGLVNTGAGATGQLGNLGAQNADAVSKLLQQQGSVQANGILGRNAMQSKTINDVESQFMKLFQGGGF
jgi:hypothetical protein